MVRISNYETILNVGMHNPDMLWTSHKHREVSWLITGRSQDFDNKSSWTLAITL